MMEKARIGLHSSPGLHFTDVYGVIEKRGRVCKSGTHGGSTMTIWRYVMMTQTDGIGDETNSNDMSCLHFPCGRDPRFIARRFG